MRWYGGQCERFLSWHPVSDDSELSSVSPQVSNSKVVPNSTICLPRCIAPFAQRTKYLFDNVQYLPPSKISAT